MPDDYDDIRRRLTNYEKGLYFELGRAQERGETPEKGWVRQFRIETKEGARVLDNARTAGRGTEAVERKSGRINEVDARAQLRKERDGLKSGQLAQSRWETVAGEKVPEKVREDMRALARDFPGRFKHEIVSRADALRAIRLGESLVSKQLELVRAYELDRADRARQRLANIRRIARAKERAEHFRTMDVFRESAARGRADAPRQVQAERAEQAREQAERAKAREAPATERERAERKAAELIAQLYPPPSQSPVRETDTERAERDRAETQWQQKEAEKARAAQEYAERRRAAELAQIPPEVAQLLALGQAQAPEAAVRTPPGYAPGVERGGTRGQEQIRGQTRDR
uniref:hypothetical protein n=1 Tax=Nocardia suismassiliense TaxID=2077092 RepID=UPI003F4988DE